MNFPSQGFPYNPYDQAVQAQGQQAWPPPASPYNPPPAPPAQAWQPPPGVQFQPPPTPAEEYQAEGVSPQQLAAFARLQSASNPQEYAQAAHDAGLTAAGWQAAAGQLAAGVQAGPVQAPSFDEQVTEYRQRAAAAEAQVQSMNTQYTQAIQSLQNQVSQLMGAIPTRVDPVAESAAKVARAFNDIPMSDARRMLHSALHSHLVNLGLTDLAKLL